MNIVQTNNLSKSFGNTLAVNNISLQVREGEIYGFLGLNGAGKTTTIRLLLKMIKADSGTISIFNKNIDQGSSIWNDIGYLVESPHSYPDLSVRENLELIFKLRGLTSNNLIDEIINRLKLEKYKDRKAKHLSTGNNQRLGLAKALMHKPKLLILDEPINGLDPAGIVEIRDFLKELVLENETTIFLSSHILSEISKIATRIGIVNDGELIKEIDTEELENQILKELIVNTNDNHKAQKILFKNNYIFKKNFNDMLISKDKKAIEHSDEIAKILVNANLRLKTLNLFEEDLEAYFLRIIGQ